MSRSKRALGELARRELARRHFRDYLAYTQGKSWRRTKLSRFLADRVQAFLESETGRAYDILVLQTPPQHGKSMTITESLPSWWLGKHPEHRVILAAYNDELAERFLRRNREKVERFGNRLFQIRAGKVNRANTLELMDHRGGLISRGIRSGITGNPAELIVIDDPIKSREEADSEVWRNKLWEEWQNSLKSRLAAGAKVIVILTPWHEDDLAARILKNEPNAELLRLPVEAEENDPMGRRPGDALCPELGKDKNWLRDFKRGYLSDPLGGARAWTALYQCAPRAEEGSLIKRSWWRFYDPKEMHFSGTQLISVDAAFKGLSTSDFVAITVWAKVGEHYYLRHCLNRQMGFSETLRAIRSVKAQFPAADRVLIEDKANGPAIIEVLQRELFCIPVNPRGGKVARVQAVSAAIESGHVWLPERMENLAAYIDQWTAFPAGAHDDMVDSSTQALSYLLHLSGTPPTSQRDEAAEAFNDPGMYDVYELSRVWS